MIEVSSFSTRVESKERIPADLYPVVANKKRKLKAPAGAPPTWSAARAENAGARDFTVNGLLYDPFTRLLFDSVGGVADCGARLLRTISLPEESFEQDPARMG